jgi:hypothetical protein
MGAWSQLPRRLGSAWAVLLAGPIVGTVYFFVVYLLAEASCAEQLQLLGSSTLRMTILAAAVAVVVVLLAYAWRARQLWPAHPDGTDDVAQDRWLNRRFMVVTALMLLGMFVLFALFLAAPVVGATLC